MNLHSILFHLAVGRLKLCVLIALVSVTSASALHAETTATKSSVVTNSVNIPAVAATKSSVASAPITNGPATNAPTIFSLKLGPDADDDDDDASTSKSAKHSGETEEKSYSWTADGISELLIPLAGIVASFGTPVLIVYFVCAYKYRRRQDDMAVVRDCISKGVPVPPQLLNESWGTSSARDPVAVMPITRGRSDIRRGIKYAAVGLGVSLALFVHNPHSTTWAWGLIVLVIGLGFLLSGWIETRPEANNSAPKLPPVDGPR